MANKIYTNHTLEEYNKKYGNKGLKKVNKVDVAKDKSLLNGHSWWLIKDTYYQLPDNKGFTAWWHNLGKGGKIAICALLGCTVAAAVAVPTAIVLTQKKTVEHKAVIDSSVIGVTCTQKKLDNGALEVTLSYDTSKKELQEVIVTIGNQTLLLNTDYTLEGNKIVIAANVLGSNKATEIVIKPILQDKQPVKPIYVTELTCDHEKELTVGDEISFDDLNVKIKPENATDKTFTVLDGGKTNDTNPIEIDTVNRKIKAKEAGETQVLVVPNGVDPESQEQIGAICSITVKTKETNKEKFVKIADQWINGDSGFCGSNINTEYNVSNLSLTVNGTEIKSIEYFNYSGIGSNRVFKAGADIGSAVILGESISKTVLENLLEDSSDATYEFTKDYISYTNKNATTGKATSLKFNNYGYIMNYYVKDGASYGCTYKHYPTETNKFIRLYNEYKQTYLSASSIYTKDKIATFAVTAEGVSDTYTTDSIEYSTDGDGNRTATISGKNTTSQEKTTRIDSNNPEIKELSGAQGLFEAGTFVFNDNYIEYNYEDDPCEQIKCLKVNKYGYVEKYIYSDENYSDSGYEYAPSDTPKAQYTVTIKVGNSGDGTLSETYDNEKVDEGTQITINAIPDTWCIFDQWNTKADYTGEIFSYDSQITIIVNQNIELYAKFSMLG